MDVVDVAVARRRRRRCPAPRRSSSTRSARGPGGRAACRSPRPRRSRPRPAESAHAPGRSNTVSGATAHCSPCRASVGRAGGGCREHARGQPRRRPGCGSGGAWGHLLLSDDPTGSNVHRRQPVGLDPCGPGRGCSWRSVIWLCAAPAQAQTGAARRPADCLINTGCGVGLKSVYGLDVSPAFVPLTVADAGIGGARRRRRRSGGRVLLEPAGLAARHRHAARRPRDDLPGPRGPGRRAASSCAAYGERGARTSGAA